MIFTMQKNWMFSSWSTASRLLYPNIELYQLPVYNSFNFNLSIFFYIDALLGLTDSLISPIIRRHQEFCCFYPFLLLFLDSRHVCLYIMDSHKGNSSMHRYPRYFLSLPLDYQKQIVYPLSATLQHMLWKERAPPAAKPWSRPFFLYVGHTYTIDVGKTMETVISSDIS